MPLPPKDLTWREKSNVAVPSTGSIGGTQRAYWLAVILGLISSAGYNVAPSAMGTVRYSCDSVTAGTAGDGVNRLISASNIVWANNGSAHSWIVIRFNAIAANFELLITFEGTSANGTLITIYVSQSAGFTGGTTTARPTATDETPMVLAGSFGYGQDVTRKLHFSMASDGKQVRMFEFAAGAIRSCMIFGIPKNPRSGWTNPSIAYCGQGSACLDVGTLCHTATPEIRGRRAGVAIMTIYASVVGWGTGTFASNARLPAVDDWDAEMPCDAIGLATETVGCKSRKLGEIYDLWWGSPLNADGTNAPDTGTLRQVVQIGDVVTPANNVLWETA